MGPWGEWFVTSLLVRSASSLNLLHDFEKSSVKVLYSYSIFCVTWCCSSVL